MCQSYTFDISGDSGPYYGFIVSGENPCGDALKEIGQITGNSYTWKVDVSIPAGSTVMLAVENDSDVDGYSGKMSIQGSNTTCVTPAAASHTTSHATAPNNAASTPSTTGAASRSVRSSLSALGLVSVAALALAL